MLGASPFYVNESLPWLCTAYSKSIIVPTLNNMAALCKQQPTRQCLVCSKELITCKSYFSLKSKHEIADILKNIVGDFSTAASHHICDSCYGKICEIKSLSEITNESTFT